MPSVEKSHAISMIPYANMAPYRGLGSPHGCRFVHITPRQSVAALLNRRVWAAAMPVGALPSLGDAVSFLGEYGISAATAVKSVLLFSDRPFTDLGRPAKIHLTNQSATSVRLLYLLLGYAHGMDRLPEITATEENADGVLLIGDDALLRARRETDRQITDLVTEWHRIHGLPFVFARWVIRRDAPAEVRRAMLDWLDQLREQDDDLLVSAAPSEAKRIGISTDEMIDYLRGMKRVLGPDELKGQALFLSELEKYEKQFPLPRLLGMDAPAQPRLDRQQALELLRSAPLGELMARAHQERQRHHPDGLVTFVKDTNPNYTNICATRCSFCAFCRVEGDEEAYTLTADELAAKVLFASEHGATTVLLQGGHNPKIRLADWIAYIRTIRKVCPEIHIHPFSPPEIIDMADKEKAEPIDILKALRDEGIDTMPGGGAEVLTDRVRAEIAPGKCNAADWLRVMEAAHSLGFKTTATLMFGHVECDEDIIEHLFKLRDIQDRTGGFSSFIPWSFKPGRSKLSERVTQAAHPAKYLRIIAVARLVLDNVSHIQSSWFSESETAGCLGLLGGADDFGGILVEENVLRTSGYEKRTTVQKVKTLIRDAGFVPALRDSRYNITRIFEDGS